MDAGTRKSLEARTLTTFHALPLLVGKNRLVPMSLDLVCRLRSGWTYYSTCDVCITLAAW